MPGMIGDFGFGFLSFVFLTVAVRCLISARNAYSRENRIASLTGFAAALAVGVLLGWLQLWLLYATRLPGE